MRPSRFFRRATTRDVPVVPSKPLNRKAFFRLAQSYTPYVVADCDGFQVVISTSDRHWDKVFWHQRVKEEKVLARAVAQLDRIGLDIRGTTFVDVGACIGTTTLTALRAGFGRVLALEPEPSNFRILRANLTFNDAEESVRALRVALSDRVGTGTVAVVPGKSGSAHLIGDGEDSEWPTEQVSLSRLDDLAADGVLDPQQVGLLWVDVEGHEAHVLRGAGRTLEHGCPLVVELHPPSLRRTGSTRTLPELLQDRFAYILDLREEGATVCSSDRVGELLRASDREQRTKDVLAFNAPARLPRTGTGAGVGSS
jgi:FkbM family methyltransferase